MTPTKETPKPTAKSLKFLQLFRYADSVDMALMATGGLFAMINGTTLPLMTVFFGGIIEAFVSFQDTEKGRRDIDNAVKAGVIFMSILGLITIVSSYIQMSFFMLAGERQSKKIREKYFRSAISQEVAFYDKVSTGDLTNRLTSDMNLIQEGLSDKLGLIIQFTSAFLTGFVIGYTKGWQLALVLTGALPFLSGAAYILSLFLASGAQNSQAAYAGAADIAQQVLSSIRTVYAFGGEDKEKKRYSIQLDIAEKLGLRNQLFNGCGIGFLQFVVMNTYGLAFWYGNTLIPKTLTTGTALNVIFAIVIGAFSLGNASPHISAFGTALGAAEKVYETIERESSIDPLAEGGKKPSNVQGEIHFKDITFVYPSRPDAPVLQNYNLDIGPGTTVALVGTSGSGKSTIVKLLERFYDPVAGSVLIDGNDIKDLNVSWLRQQIGMVSQEPVLFNTTIKQNILLGLVNYNLLSEKEISEKIEHSCRQANCWDFIQDLPKKLETEVGESGGMLSGGQKQRIAIARAIIKNPSILLLDEATSALDTESEKVVQVALERASSNRTSIVIAHRLSTIQNATKIIVMDKGKIVESGSHHELLAMKGIYSDLVANQTIKTSGVTDKSISSAPEESVKAHFVEKREVEATHEDKIAKKSKAKKLDYQRLFAYSKPEFGIFIIASIGSVLNGATQPAFAVLFSVMLTALGTERANFYALLFVGLSFVAFLSNFMQGLFKYAGEKAIRRIRFDSFEALLRQEVGFFDQEENSVGALMSRLSEDASLVPGLTGQTFGALVQGVGGVGCGLGIAFASCWQLAFVILGMIPIIMFAGLLQIKALIGFGDKTKKSYEKVSQTANESIGSIRTIMTIGQEKHFIDNFKNAISGPHRITIEGAFVSAASFAFGQSILHFVWATSLFYGAQLIKWGLYTPDMVLRAMFSVIFTAMALGQVANFAPDAAKANNAALNIFALLDRESKIDGRKTINGKALVQINGNVDTTDVFFAYPTRAEQTILKGLNIKANPGTTVALVGKSGCGKSTVMGLLERWYDSTSGTVSIDEISTTDWKLSSLRSKMAIVGQEPILFNVSIRDNIAYGALESSDDLAIFEAAKTANIHDFILGLPDGYDTLVGEKGGKMSGGQKQRIAIARALIRNPKILLLDEATSALDSESESVVQQALDAAAKGRTTLVIAHRLSTIQNADCIFVVEQGVVKEAGLHAELMEKAGIYIEGESHRRSKTFLLNMQEQSTDESEYNKSRESHVLIYDSKTACRRRQDCSFLNRWSYSYFFDILKIGAEKNIEPHDFPPIEDCDIAELISEEIEKEFDIQKGLHGKKATLINVLWKVFGYRYTLAGIGFFIEFLIQLSQGWFLAQLLTALANPTPNNTEIYLYAFGLAVDTVGYTIFHHGEWFITLRTGLQIRVGLIAAIYRKILKISLANVSSGVIVNLVSNDVQRFEDSSPFLHYIWVTPLQIIGYMTLIYFQIGWAFIAALGTVFLLLPVQYVFSKAFKTYRNETVVFRDERIKIISDMISGIAVVKLYNWEIPFIAKINEWRKKELKYIWAGNILKAMNEAIFFSSGVFINALTFTFYWLFGGELTPAKVFSTTIFLMTLKLSVCKFIPAAAQFVSECIVSIERLNTFFHLEEVEDTPKFETEKNIELQMENASFKWSNSSEDILENLSFNVNRGKLLFVCGSVGSGKSSLLHSILGDMLTSGGKVYSTARKIAYVSQIPWILSGTIQENILFESPFDEARLSKAIDAASLERDITLFPKGLHTFIGERGVTLSGGQRARVALARAVYSNSEFYLLDDPLSAVDTKVGRQIFDRCINGALKGKTIILVTHQLQFLPQADQIIYLEKGKIIESGTFEQLSKNNSDFSRAISKYGNTNDQSLEDVGQEKQNIGKDDDHESFQNEEMFTGSVSRETYVNYFSGGGNIPTTLTMAFVFILCQGVSVSADYWLSIWSKQKDQSSSIWIIVSLTFAAGTVILSIMRAIMFFAVCFRSSKKSFENMLSSVFAAPMVFFQSNPQGRIMNRFSKDINLIDENLPQLFFDLCQCFVMTFAVFVVAAAIVPYLLLVYPFILYVFIKLRDYYMKTSRQLKRIEAISRSPIYTTIPSTLEGLSTIRAFKAEKRFLKEFFAHQDENTRFFFSYLSSGRWLGFRLDLIVGLLVTIIMFVILPLRDNLGLSNALIGFLISYLLQMLGTLQWAVRQASEVENLMVSQERVHEYMQLPKEGNNESDEEIRPDPSWPKFGKVEFKKMSLCYPDFQHAGKLGSPVLKNLTVTFEAGKKIGIVGRTGAGKSSLLQALFRLVEPSTDSIIIDSLPTSKIDLSTLRSNISIIPQEPFCFKGTLRFNLDPFNKYADKDIWDVLKATELSNKVSALPLKLDSAVAENGSNWSIGERQLICLARAVLRNTSLLVMDEATASVDMKTDQLVQDAIRTLFSNSTVLTIAHRLQTVIDYDYILVLDGGEIKEYGSPRELLKKDVEGEDSWFSKMVHVLGQNARRELLNKVK